MALDDKVGAHFYWWTQGHDQVDYWTSDSTTIVLIHLYTWNTFFAQEKRNWICILIEKFETMHDGVVLFTLPTTYTYNICLNSYIRWTVKYGPVWVWPAFIDQLVWQSKIKLIWIGTSRQNVQRPTNPQYVLYLHAAFNAQGLDVPCFVFAAEE